MVVFNRALMHAASLSLIILLSGCGGDGAQGPTGAQGPQGDPGTTPEPTYPDPTALVVQFNSASVDGGTVTANFQVQDQDGHPYSKLSGYRFTIAKLIPGDNGDSSHWQSYINRVEAAGNIGPGTQDTIQATSESDGNLTNNGDGSYSYTFSHNLEAISDPMAVSFNADMTHRIAIQVSGNDQPVANAVYDWQPSSGNTSGIFNRKIVKTESCNSCHGNLALHGGGRTDVDYCVTCHNPGSTDAQSGNSVNFAQLVHKLHRGAELPSVEGGGEYAIWGYRNSKHDYSDVHFPQDIRNCTTCHNDEDSQTPQAQQWHMVPTMQACGSCHDNVNFAMGKDGGHPGGVQVDNSECTVCHASGKLVGSPIESHKIPAQTATKTFKYTVVEVSNTAPGEFPVIRFSVTDPQNGDAPYDLTTDPAFTTGGGVSRLYVDLAWGSGRDFTNFSSGSGVASTASINALGSPQNNGDGTYTVTSTTAIPAGASGTLAVTLEGHPAGDYDGDGVYSDRVPVTSAIKEVAIGNGSATPRREVVDIAKCNNCHQQLSLHGNNRTDNIEVCTTCHNPNNTDLTRRPADPSQTPDGMKEASIDFKYMIHAIHAADMRNDPEVVYGYGSSVNNFSDLRFPGQLNNCETCHNDDTYELPLSDKVLATTVDSGAAINDPSDDLNITATAAVCSSCHDSPLAKAHMKQNGGASFEATQQQIDKYEVVETCQFCHGAGQEQGVKKVHGIK